MIDGTIARKTDSVSEFGSMLDIVADFIFVGVCLLKLLPAINIPTWLLIWIGFIAVVKIINVATGFICCMRFAAIHTCMNKLTGLLLFILPLTLPFIEGEYSASFVCGVATFAAIQEGCFTRAGRIGE